MCLYLAKISDERLQDRWSSGSLLICHEDLLICHEDLVMEIFHSSADTRLIVKEHTLSTDKLPAGGLLRNSVFRVNDHPNITSAV